MTHLALVDPLTADDPVDAWTSLITAYYDGCSSGDVDAMVRTLHPEVIHWFLAPNRGSTAIRGAAELARFWRMVTGLRQARWVVDTICATAQQAVIEWSMWWQPEEGAERVVTRGAEWFIPRDGLIGEIRSYYQLRDESTQLDGFPYAEREYSVAGAERSPVHPAAGQFGPGISPTG